MHRTFQALPETFDVADHDMDRTQDNETTDFVSYAENYEFENKINDYSEPKEGEKRYQLTHGSCNFFNG